MELFKITVVALTLACDVDSFTIGSKGRFSGLGTESSARISVPSQPQHHHLQAATLLTTFSGVVDKNEDGVRNIGNGAEFDELPYDDVWNFNVDEIKSSLSAKHSAFENEMEALEETAIRQTFSSFDTDQNNEVDFDELRAGLEKILETELSESHLRALMTEFDTSGDGALQLNELNSGFLRFIDYKLNLKHTVVKSYAL